MEIDPVKDILRSGNDPQRTNGKTGCNTYISYFHYFARVVQ